jgi:hypothetical protein
LGVALFVGLIANGFVLPLLLLCFGAALLAFRYWDALKAFDLWTLDECARTRMGAIGIREWHSPYHAAEHFCDPKIVRARNEAAAAMNSIMMELIRDQDRTVGAHADAIALRRSENESVAPLRNGKRRHADYEAAQVRLDQNNLALARGLLSQLVVGSLVAKGMPTQNDVTHSELIIPASRWRIMDLNIAKAEASGRGLHYIGVVIGKK